MAEWGCASCARASVSESLAQSLGLDEDELLADCADFFFAAGAPAASAEHTQLGLPPLSSVTPGAAMRQPRPAPASIALHTLSVVHAELHPVPMLGVAPTAANGCWGPLLGETAGCAFGTAVVR